MNDQEKIEAFDAIALRLGFAGWFEPSHVVDRVGELAQSFDDAEAFMAGDLVRCGCPVCVAIARNVVEVVAASKTARDAYFRG